MTVRQQLIAKTKKKQCLYCGKWRLIAELDKIDYGEFQCPEHDTAKINDKSDRSAESTYKQGLNETDSHKH